MVIGDNAVLTTTFTVGGVNTDPTTVVLTVQAPDGTETTPSVSNTAVGVYTADFEVDQAGTWLYRWVGSGAAVGVDEGAFRVDYSLLGPPAGLLVSLAKVKQSIGITGTGKDDETTDAILAASRLIQDLYEREFTPTTSATRTFAVDPSGWVDLAPYDLRTITTVTLDPAGAATVLTTADYETHPYPARHGVYTALDITKTLPTTTGRLTVSIAGAWGFAAVPLDVERACIETVRAVTRSDPGNWAAVASQDGRPVDPMPQGTYALPAAAKAWLDPYKRYTGIA